VAEHGEEPVQLKLHKCLRLWSFYVDLEESLGTLDSARKIYERMFDLKIVTAQIVLNYAALLEVLFRILQSPISLVQFC
jgi:pre-mRNA-splicing factor SYF1